MFDALFGLRETEALLKQLVAVLQKGFSYDYAWQLAAFLLSVGAGWYFARHLNARLYRCQKPDTDKTSSRLQNYAVDVAAHLSFSLIAASVLWCLVWVMRETNLVSDHQTLVLAKLGYMVLYLFALLRVLLYVLQGMFGHRLVSPGVARVVTWVYWVLVALEFIGVLPALVGSMKSTTFTVGSQPLTLWTIATGTLSAMLTLGVANWIANILEETLRHLEGLAPNLQVVLSRIGRWVLIAGGILIAMRSVGIDLTVLSVFGGAVGVGLGFGLQKIASNYVSGFIILLDHSIKIGDYVELAGFKGIVTEINTRYTVVRDAYGVENIVPNETFVTNSVKNYYHSDTNSVVMIRISVAYGTDLNRAIAILKEEANKPDRVMKDRQGWAGITALGDSAIDLEAGIWVSDIGRGTSGLRTGILINVLKRYEEEGIEVPFPQMDVTLKNLNQIGVPLEKAAAALAKEQQKAAEDSAAD